MVNYTLFVLLRKLQEEGFEPSRLSTTESKSAASAISPLLHIGKGEIRTHCVCPMGRDFGFPRI